MPFSVENEPDQDYAFMAKIDNSKNVHQLLKAVNFKDYATVFASGNGLKITVEDAKCVQANAFIQAEMFQDYTIKEEIVTFMINLTILVECLNIFGSGPSQGMNRALKMCYSGYGEPLVLLLEEGGAVTHCRLKTRDTEDTLDFNFSNTDVVNKIIMRAECLKEIFSELDLSSELMEIMMCPNAPYFQISTFGNYGINRTSIPSTSDMVESFSCSSTTVQRYKIALLKPSIKPLGASQKVSIRIDKRGFLCLQFMIKTGDNHICFIEYFCSPEECAGEDD